MSFIQKKYIYKIFSATDGLYAGALNPNDIVSDISYSTSIYGGPGEATITLVRKARNFGEGKEIALGNRVKVYCFDRDTGFDGSEVLVYDGYISAYDINEGEYRDSVTIILLGWMAELDRYMLRDGNDTEVTYSATDPTNMFKDILDKFTALGGVVNYDGTSTELCGYNDTYTFNTSTVLRALNRCLDLAPSNYFWTVYPNNIAYLKSVPTTPDLFLRVGRNISIISIEKRIENLVNRIYFTGGGDPPLYYEFEREGSIATWRLYETAKVDERVIIPQTAQRISDRILNLQSQPAIRVTAKLFDNNGADDGMGIDLESLRVGQVLRISGFSKSGYTRWDEAIWDQNYWDYDIVDVTATNLIIVKIDYSPNSATIEMTTRLPNIARRVEEVARSLQDAQTSNNPTTPS